MRRVLVPLDGSVEAEKIFPDARRLAGPDGELILVREASLPVRVRDMFADATTDAIEDAEWYLEHEAEKLRDDGVRVRTQWFVLADAASAIDEAARLFEANMIAIATHGRGPVSRLVRGGVAWRALAHSPVPVLLRHIEHAAPSRHQESSRRHIMVPLDGSAYAEKALPVAHELALEWNAALWLVQVIPEIPSTVVAGLTAVPAMAVADEESVRQAHGYLEGLARNLRCEVHVQAAYGPIVDTLVRDADRFFITDIVMATHGRTGLSRVILGSVADELIHRLHMPIVMVPALACGRLEDETPTMPVGTVAGD